MDEQKKRKRWAGQDSWDKENVTTLGCKVRQEEAAAFKDYAAGQGKTSNTVLKEYVVECIERDVAKGSEHNG